MPTILESSHREFRSFVVDATGQQHVLPVIVTEHGVLDQFARYMHLNHRKSRSWQDSSVFAVRLLLEFIEANHAFYDEPRMLFTAFSDALFTGTVSNIGDPSGLWWQPRQPDDAGKLIGHITKFTDWLALVNEDAMLQLNPWRQATRHEERLNWAAYSHRRDKAFLSHLWRSKPQTNQSRAVRSRTMPFERQTPAKAFPEECFDQLVSEGFRRRARDSPGPIDLRNVLITYLMHYGGVRLSEALSLSIAVPPVDSTTVVELPETLGDLQEQLEKWGSDLSGPLYESVFEAIPEGVSPSRGNGEGILILLWVPRTRQGKPERIDVLGFMMTSSLYELAEAFDMLGFSEANGLRRRIALVGGQRGTAWRSLAPMPVEVRSALTASLARDLSAVAAESAQFDGVLAGVGALGSALADLWIRQGWGHWTFVDPDQLMPHNLSRHVASDCDIGRDKSDVMREIATWIYPNEPPPAAIAKSILSQDEDVLAALSQAQLVVDVTTTFQAPRGLARRDTAPRTASLFMTPSGLSSVMILEDEARLQRLDGLEGQYYRAILESDWGREHLANHLGDRWVGGGCRDISVRISNECIHIHAGILSRQLRQSVAKAGARLCVWTYDEQTGAIISHEVSLSNVHTTNSNGWTIKYDSVLVEKLRQARLAALPNEVGGSLVGVTDLKARAIVIVDVLPTPPDSQCSPSHFIRGEDGQQEALEEVHRRTARVVDYLGEWHSHPDGVPAHPSLDDKNLLNTIHRKMGVEGLPALMVIVARSEISFIVRYEGVA